VTMEPEKVTTRWLFYLSAASVSVVLPVCVWRLSLISSPDSYRLLPQVFKIFALCASAAIALAAFVELGRKRDIPPDRVISIVLGILLSSFFLASISADASRSYDYGCYEGAAHAIVRGQNPYRDCYLYPPLVAQVMAGLYRAAAWSAVRAGLEAPEPTLWNIVFYLYQCSQFLLIVSAYVLCCRFGRIIGLSRLASSTLSAGLLIFNTPLLHTLKEKQVNLWVADLILLALITAWKHPLISGWAIALSAHIKLYPAMLMIPAAVMRQKKLIAGFASGLAVIALALALWERGPHLWFEYAGFMSLFPEQRLPGNLSLNGFFNHCLNLSGFPEETRGLVFRYCVGATLILTKCAIVAWFAVRFAKRERAFLGANPGPDDARARMFRFYAHSMDILGLSLLVSPILWDHHFVLALPLALWAVAAHGRRRPWQMGIGVFLMLGQPSMDLFPLSFLRPAGLFLLLWYSAPDGAVARASSPVATPEE
jgi:hypothetical protein